MIQTIKAISSAIKDKESTIELVPVSKTVLPNKIENKKPTKRPPRLTAYKINLYLLNGLLLRFSPLMRYRPCPNIAETPKEMMIRKMPIPTLSLWKKLIPMNKKEVIKAGIKET